MMSPARYLLGLLFRFYRSLLSPMLGKACRFEPSCSRYSEEAIERFGFFRGFLLTLWRLARCQPFAKGGLDPVPVSFCGCKREPRRIS